MLILSRKKGERICIGGTVEVLIADVSNTGEVRLGIEAPSDVLIMRKEVRDCSGCSERMPAVHSNNEEPFSY
jgi:carbon storage regulator